MLGTEAASRAHPRSRGENAMWIGGGQNFGGSSPLTRGKLENGRTYRVVVGLIPAHAGKTCSSCGGGVWLGAHPRSRGENGFCDALVQGLSGSSPLTRGKHDAGQGRQRDRGLIPAHAGKTSCIRSMGTDGWAHPRSRGENASQVVGLDGIRGSSPLTRGKPEPSKPSAIGSGLIPAHAGKTGRTPRGASPSRAHPRSRGENGERSVAENTARGSSPLTRGKHRELAPVVLRGGLIPAHAGKTR